MEIPSPDTAQAEMTARAFRAALDTLPRPLFAVLDGGQFDDLEDELADAGISSRSLFMQGGDEAIRRDGPWLVALNDRGTREHVEELALQKPCAVFWSCPAGEQALWRHLRSINEVLIPDVRFPDQDGRSGKHERVLFRHWDPTVLAPVLPLLDVEQFAHLFGPAQAIFMNAAGSGGLTRAPRPENMPQVPKGVLTLRADQLEAVDARRRDEYCRRMSGILREMAPQETAGMSEEELNDRVLRYEASGNWLGLTQERSLSIWGFLMISSQDRFATLPKVTAFVRSGPETPDENVETLLQQITRLAGTVGEAT